MSTGEKCHVEHVHKDHEGNNLYFEITVYPLKDRRGEVTHIIHLLRDVSERRQAEEELREKVYQSERLTALGQLMAEITHEIRNPLMMIGGFAKQLLPPTDEGTKVKKLTIIIEQVKRLETLLADLREFFLPKTSAVESVNIRVVLEKVISLVKDECAKKHIEIEIMSQEEAFFVKGDQGKLEQVFLNVIKNAIESMEKGGQLSIGIALTGGRADITIEDAGCGIPEENMDKILECFFTTKSYGSGLGLCISKKYIDGLEGGYLSVESEEGKGTTVNIKLPLDPKHPDIEAESPLKSNQIAFKDRKINRELSYHHPPVAF
jgi:signal transduction histidine kinase